MHPSYIDIYIYVFSFDIFVTSAACLLIAFNKGIKQGKNCQKNTKFNWSLFLFTVFQIVIITITCDLWLSKYSVDFCNSSGTQLNFTYHGFPATFWLSLYKSTPLAQRPNCTSLPSLSCKRTESCNPLQDMTTGQICTSNMGKDNDKTPSIYS